MRVLNGLAQALNMPSDKLLRFLGRHGEVESTAVSTETAIATDDLLTEHQKQSLIDVYRAFRSANEAAASAVLIRSRRVAGRASVKMGACPRVQPFPCARVFVGR